MEEKEPKMIKICVGWDNKSDPVIMEHLMYDVFKKHDAKLIDIGRAPVFNIPLDMTWMVPEGK